MLIHPRHPITHLLGCLLLLASSPLAKGIDRPDILMIVVDDLNDWIPLLDPEAPARTPHLDQLATRGMTFTRAYCMAPACNPSRVATLTGLRPSTTGVYGNRSDWKKALPNRPTIMQALRASDYQVMGAGKVFHHQLDGAFHDPKAFDAYTPMRKQRYPITKLNRAPGYGSRNTDWGAWPEKEEETIDAGTIEACIQALENRDPNRPLFLVCGLFKPHSPFFAPRAFHPPPHTLPLPVPTPFSRSEWPAGAWTLQRPSRWFWKGMMDLEREQPGSYRQWVESYVACVQFMDHQLGRLMEALDASPRGKETMIILWSDHGFHLGERHHMEKFMLWEKTTRIPLIVVLPGTTLGHQRCDTPVDLSTLYPTLLEVAGGPSTIPCDGKSLIPLLKNPEVDWQTPAITTYLPGNHAIRSPRWRYIRYADGSEELYDHSVDPEEWVNLAQQAHAHAIKKRLAGWLPQNEATATPNLKR